MLKKLKKSLLLAFVLWTAGASAATQNVPLAADGGLWVRNIAGLVEIEVWDKPELEIQADLDDPRLRLEVTGDERYRKVEVRYPRGGRGYDSGEARLRIKVPKRVGVAAETVSGDIEVRDLLGNVRLQTVSGDIGAEVNAQSLNLQTVSGDIRARSPQAIQARSVSGDVWIQQVGQKLVAESVSGDVHVDVATVPELSVKTVSGDVELRANPQDTSRWRVETMSGEVLAKLPVQASAQLSMQTFSGDAECELGQTHPRNGGKTTQVRLGNGTGRLEFSSFSGDIRVIKQLLTP